MSSTISKVYQESVDLCDFETRYLLKVEGRPVMTNGNHVSLILSLDDLKDLILEADSMVEEAEKDAAAGH